MVILPAYGSRVRAAARVTTFAEAAAFLGNRATRRLANNTWLRRDGADCVLTLHGNPIITYHPGGGVTLRSGGWRSVTTKRRLNQFAPVQVWQRRREWFVAAGGAEAPFRDGMRIDAHGRILPEVNLSAVYSYTWTDDRDPTARGLAERVLQTRDPAALGILADRLEEIGHPDAVGARAEHIRCRETEGRP
jgi:hypothetical protein